MKYNYVGIELLKVAAFLFAARYITAALVLGGLNYWDSNTFHASYLSIGSDLTIGAGISAAAGITALFVAAGKKSMEKTNNKETCE